MYRRLFIIAKEHCIGLAGLILLPIYYHEFSALFFRKSIFCSLFGVLMAQFGSAASEQYSRCSSQHKRGAFIGYKAPFAIIPHLDKWVWLAEDGKFMLPGYFFTINNYSS